MQTIKVPWAACGPRDGPDSCHWPVPPQASPSEYLHAASPNSHHQPPLPCTHLRLAPLVDKYIPAQGLHSCSCTHSCWPWRCQWSWPCHCMGVCSQPLSPCTHLQLPQGQVCAYPGSSDYHNMPWSLATWPRGTIKDQEPLKPLSTSAALAKDHTIVNVMDHSCLSWQDIMHSWTQNYHMPWTLGAPHH